MKIIIEWLPPLSAICIYVARIVELRTRRNTIAGTVREHLTLRLFVAIGTAMLLGSIVEYLLVWRTVSWPFFVSGWAVALLSIYLRRSAIAALGPFWSLHVEIRETHKLVRDGPFRWIRHPVYSSMILEILSIGLLLRSWVTMLFVYTAFLPTLLARVWIEEKTLIEKFGDAYLQYRRQVPAILPYKVPCA